MSDILGEHMLGQDLLDMYLEMVGEHILENYLLFLINESSVSRTEPPPLKTWKLSPFLLINEWVHQSKFPRMAQRLFIRKVSNHIWLNRAQPRQ